MSTSRLRPDWCCTRLGTLAGLMAVLLVPGPGTVCWAGCVWEGLPYSCLAAVKTDNGGSTDLRLLVGWFAIQGRGCMETRRLLGTNFTGPGPNRPCSLFSRSLYCFCFPSAMYDLGSSGIRPQKRFIGSVLVSFLLLWLNTLAKINLREERVNLAHNSWLELRQ